MADVVTMISIRLCISLVLLLLAVNADAGRNILFISIDDLRVEPQAITPNLDAFAAASTRYNRAYATVPVCVGSRATVMTGLKPSTHNLVTAFPDQGQVNAVFANPNITTLPEVLSANGYYTATTGKVNHTQFPGKWDQAQPYTSIHSLQDPLDPGPDGTYINPQVLPQGTIHPDQEVATWAVDFINSYDGSQPFFLAIGFSQPHLPWVLPQWAFDLYPAPTVYEPVVDDFNDEPSAAALYALAPIFNGQFQYSLVQAAGKAQDYTAAYLAAVSHTDYMLGQVLTVLQQSSFAANTDIIVWSDHGFHLGEKFHWRKVTFWEQSVRAPLYIQSAAIPAGDVMQEVSLLDLPPTVLDLAGLSSEPQFEGVSLVSGASPVEVYYGTGKATISNGTKSIDYNTDLASFFDIASYYLPNDPTEEVNLTPPPGC